MVTDIDASAVRTTSKEHGTNAAYGLSRPTVDEARVAVHRVFRDRGASTWSRFLADARVSPNATQPYVVPDTTVEPIEMHNPLVLHDGVHAYAGVPLVSRSGQVLGAHCLLGPEAEDFTDDDVGTLATAAEEIVDILSHFERGTTRHRPLGWDPRPRGRRAGRRRRRAA
jgi:GAF domain-containing protein